MAETDKWASPVGVNEMPTELASLKILLVTDTRRSGPVVYYVEKGLGWRLLLGRLLRPLMRTGHPAVASEEIPQLAVSMSAGTPAQAGRLPAGTVPSQGAAGDVLLTALYLEAERTCLTNESPYDVDRGLQRFHAWLDDEVEPPREISC